MVRGLKSILYWFRTISMGLILMRCALVLDPNCTWDPRLPGPRYTHSWGPAAPKTPLHPWGLPPTRSRTWLCRPQASLHCGGLWGAGSPNWGVWGAPPSPPVVKACLCGRWRHRARLGFGGASERIPLRRPTFYTQDPVHRVLCGHQCVPSFEDSPSRDPGVCTRGSGRLDPPSK